MNRSPDDLWRGWNAEEPTPETEGVLQDSTEEAMARVVQQAREVLEVVPGERRLMLSFGCRVHQLDTLQAPVEKNTGAALIEEALERWAPNLRVERAEVDDVGDGWLRVRLKLPAAWCSFNMAHRRQPRASVDESRQRQR